MSRRNKALLIVVVTALVAALIPVGVSLADYTAEDCEDGVWEVRPNQTLYFIAYTCDVSVNALVEYNGIENPNLIRTGEILLIPPKDWLPGDATPENPNPAPEEPADAPTPTPVPPPPPSGSGGNVTVNIGQPSYSGDGRVATVDISVYNNNVTPRLAGGRYYPNQGPEDVDDPIWVTLIGAVHDTIPYPQVINEPLWHATVYTDDGLSFPAYAGCIYYETIFAEGDEPLHDKDNTWWHWETSLEGGWFDCGNAYQVKPENLLPGESGSAPLTVYLIHPREWEDVPTVDRKIVRIDLEMFDSTGRSLGTVASKTFQ